jgi:hypothetical protein
MLFALAAVGAGLWEGNTEFFEGNHKGNSGEEK